jgi:hypothetical protein
MSIYHERTPLLTRKIPVLIWICLFCDSIACNDHPACILGFLAKFVVEQGECMYFEVHTT